MNIDRQQSHHKKIKYKYLDKSLNNSLNKNYRSPQKKEYSLLYPRRNTIEDFSPYRTVDYQHNKFKKNITEEIIMQNQLLNHQLIQYKNIVSKLEDQNRSLMTKNQFLDKSLHEERLMYQGIVTQLKGQIQLVLSKNLMLQDQFKSIAELRTKQKILSQNLREDEINLRQQLSQMIVLHQIKQNKVEASFNTNNRILKSSLEVVKIVQNILKKNSVLEQFVRSIKQMYRKIENQNFGDYDLKYLWKWLKSIGQQHNYFNKLKKPLSKKLSISHQKPIQQMIEKLLVQQLNGYV